MTKNEQLKLKLPKNLNLTKKLVLEKSENKVSFLAPTKKYNDPFYPTSSQFIPNKVFWVFLNK